MSDFFQAEGRRLLPWATYSRPVVLTNEEWDVLNRKYAPRWQWKLESRARRLGVDFNKYHGPILLREVEKAAFNRRLAIGILGGVKK